jgi:1-acyl-sn-glycerol-3-phosphate acyltransferase
MLQTASSKAPAADGTANSLTLKPGIPLDHAWRFGGDFEDLQGVIPRRGTVPGRCSAGFWWVVWSGMSGFGESRVSAVLAVANGAFRMAAAAAADALAAVDLIHVTDAKGPPSDPFAARDADYIRQTLPALRALSEIYFRADVSGLDRIPAQGPVLLVGNHSGGTMIADTFVFAQAFYDHFGPDRRFHQLAHDLVFKVPGLRTLVQQYGTVPAAPENMRRALESDAALLVYPGGDEESFRPSWESSTVAFAGRTGFVKLALEFGVPIVPVVALGGQETGLFLGRGRRIASVLSLDRLARLKVVPPVLGPPFGITVLDFPGRIPLPSKITIRVMPPIDLRKMLGANGDIEEGYRLVTSRMQRTLTRLQGQRSLPVVG